MNMDTMESQRTFAHEDSDSDNIDHAGAMLLDQARKDASRGKRCLFQYEIDVINKSYETLAGSLKFKRYVVECLRIAVRRHNYDMAKQLFGKGLPCDFLESQHDILQAAISCGKKNAYYKDIGPFIETVELLVAHGAPVNALDSDGNSPLYYACTRPHRQVFQYLVDVGADMFTMHTAVDSGDDPDGGGSTAAPRPSKTSKVNLLQIALDVHMKEGILVRNSSAWVGELHQLWGPIIMSLLDAGLRVDPCDPSLVSFLHIACRHGSMECTSSLLNAGVDLDSRAGPGDERGYDYGSALHAATAGACTSIMKVLIDHGADPSARRICREISKEFLTPFAVACSWRGSPRATRNFPDICEVLLDSGLDDAEKMAVLWECALRGHAGLVKRLLDDGQRIAEVPNCNNVEVVKLLLSSGAKINSSELQEHAAGQGCVELLDYLVERDGLCIREEQFRWIVYSNIRNHGKDDRTPMLRYLANRCLSDINEVFSCNSDPTMRTSMLQLAVEERGFETVELLLREGADPQYPGLQGSALGFLAERLDPNYGIAYKDLQLLCLLLRDNRQETNGNRGKSSSCAVHSRLMHDYARTLLSQIKQNDLRSSQMDENDMIPELYTLPRPNRLPSFSNATPFMYERLRGLKLIRLLELQPSTADEDLIQTRLFEADLSQEPSYEALSYVWGDPSDRVSILINRCQFQIPLNLWSALFRLRDRNRPRVLWVDAVCINQDDLDEKHQQIRIMRDIYQTAGKVIVWLGEHADDSHLVFQHPEKGRKGDINGGINPPIYSESTEKAFQRLCRRPWFFRAWVIQELCLSKEAVLQCGPDSKSWSALQAPWTTEMNTDAYHPLRGYHSPHRVGALNNFKENRGLQMAIEYSRLCQASDPKDNVYGILGLFDTQLIPIDYGVSTSEIYRRFTQAVIERTRSLRLLHCLSRREVADGAPSWVPDYGNSQPLWIMRGPRTKTVGMFPSKVLPGIRFCGPDLVVKGKYIDIVQATGDELAVDPECIPGSEVFTEVLRGWESLAIRLADKRLAYTVTDAFGQTLVAKIGKLQEGRSVGYMDFTAWYHVYGAGVLRQNDPDYFAMVKDILYWSKHEYRFSSMERDLTRYADKMERVCYGRRFFTTDSGTMGLGSPLVRPGDQIVFLPGGAVPFIVRGRGDSAHQLVGDCHLHDFDAEGLFKNDDPEVEEFILH